MRRYFFWKSLFLCVAVAVWTASGCECGPPITPDGQVLVDGKLVDAGPTDGTVGPDGTKTGDAVKDEPVGCPPFWTEKMTAPGGTGQLAAVFCPPPTITGCHALRTGPKCEVADTPLMTFFYDPTTKLYEVHHSGSIEENSHGDLEVAPDATQPDKVVKLPANVKIKALISGVPISFQFTGEEVKVFAPE